MTWAFIMRASVREMINAACLWFDLDPWRRTGVCVWNVIYYLFYQVKMSEEWRLRQGRSVCVYVCVLVAHIWQSAERSCRLTERVCTVSAVLMASARRMVGFKIIVDENCCADVIERGDDGRKHGLARLEIGMVGTGLTRVRRVVTGDNPIGIWCGVAAPVGSAPILSRVLLELFCTK